MDNIAKLCVGDVSPNGIVSIIDEDRCPSDPLWIKLIGIGSKEYICVIKSKPSVNPVLQGSS